MNHRKKKRDRRGCRQHNHRQKNQLQQKPQPLHAPGKGRSPPLSRSEAGGSEEQPTTAQLPEQSSKKNKQRRTEPEEEAGQLHEDGPPAAEDAPAPAFPDPPGEGAASGAGLGADSGAYPPETAEFNAADVGTH